MLSPLSHSHSLQIPSPYLSIVPNPFSLSLIFFSPNQCSFYLPLPICLLSPTVPPIHHCPLFPSSNPFPVYRCYSLQTSLILTFPTPTHTIAAENHPSKPLFSWKSLYDEKRLFSQLYLWRRQRRLFWQRQMISFAIISMIKTKTTT